MAKESDRSDLELKPLWSSNTLRSKGGELTNRNLLAMPVGLKQKDNVDAVVQKFIPANFLCTIFITMETWINGGIWNGAQKPYTLLHHNQTEWWFANGFSILIIVSNLRLMFSFGDEVLELELQPAKNSVRLEQKYSIDGCMISRGNMKCSNASEGPPCTGFVEGMASSVFKIRLGSALGILYKATVARSWYCGQCNISSSSIQTLGGSRYPDKKMILSLFYRLTRSVVSRFHSFGHFPLYTEARLSLLIQGQRYGGSQHGSFKLLKNDGTERLRKTRTGSTGLRRQGPYGNTGGLNGVV
ncbi:hypothetical protein Rs2_43524 [Raphanus sativus]|nr:hypothetical protein Rs2_43524 [Raphanus sativus]